MAKNKRIITFFKDSEVYDHGSSIDYRLFGPCETVCMGLPALATTQRGKDIVTILSTVSSMAVLVEYNSERYQAACWLVNDDLKEHKANDPKLMQRNTLAMLYLTIDGANWEAKLGFMGGEDECVWEAFKYNDEGFVTYLYLGKNAC